MLCPAQSVYLDHVEKEQTDGDGEVVHHEETESRASHQVEGQGDHQRVEKDVKVLRLLGHLDAWWVVVLNLLQVLCLGVEVHLTVLRTDRHRWLRLFFFHLPLFLSSWFSVLLVDLTLLIALGVDELLDEPHRHDDEEEEDGEESDEDHPPLDVLRFSGSHSNIYLYN